ncbi:MAG: TerB family tellurite resistance protein [Leptolyngbyaceae cyanobacterium SM2_3_12]|nr:TerB family tellurite resistance protein [Leptolyngbyaceae cyanobacterium SM2_3_12]
MKINRPGASSLTRNELEDLDTLKVLIEGAIADGVITGAERDRIRALIWADGKVSPQELNLVQDIIWNKIQTGELVLEWN